MNKERTCFKIYTSLSCIDLYLTNCPKIFESTLTTEIGLSDFHKLIVTVLKVKHENIPSKIIQYRDSKTFDLTRFQLQVRLTLLDINNLDFESLKKCFIELLNKVAPLKIKFLIANHSKFVTKDVTKAIMLRTKLRNQFLNKRTLGARTKYSKQRNICVSLVKNAKQIHHKYLDLKHINDNKKFWATVKPLSSNKIKSLENFFLDELGKIVRNEVKVANIFNQYGYN